VGAGRACRRAVDGGRAGPSPYPRRRPDRPRDPSMPDAASTAVLAAVERLRKRLWAHCYRMTGHHADADDLCQEAIARAIERSAELATAAKADAWLFRIATTVCLDHLRRRRRIERATDLVDPVVLEGTAAP